MIASKDNYMIEQNVACAKAYYHAINDKKILEIEKYLDSNIQLIGPMSSLTGKEVMLDALREYMKSLTSLTICAAFGSSDQVVIIYDVECPAPVGIVRAASFMMFKDNLISRIELLYDPRPFFVKN
jgi:hypothetical protein